MNTTVISDHNNSKLKHKIIFKSTPKLKVYLGKATLIKLVIRFNNDNVFQLLSESLSGCQLEYIKWHPDANLPLFNE